MHWTEVSAMCQSPMPLAEYRALQERIKAEYPTCCPRCHSDSDFYPTFDADGAMFGCLCGHIWTVED